MPVAMELNGRPQRKTASAVDNTWLSKNASTVQHVAIARTSSSCSSATGAAAAAVSPVGEPTVPLAPAATPLASASSAPLPAGLSNQAG